MRREEILAAAFDEFAEHGLDGTSTDVIARKAGVSQPYLFRLFGTKKELYLESVRRCLRELPHFDELARYYPQFRNLKTLLFAVDLRSMINLKL